MERTLETNRRYDMARTTENRRRVRRSDEQRLEGVDRRIERRMDSLADAYEEGDYQSLVRHADAIADAAEQGAELSDR